MEHNAIENTTHSFSNIVKRVANNFKDAAGEMIAKGAIYGATNKLTQAATGVLGMISMGGLLIGTPSFISHVSSGTMTSTFAFQAAGVLLAAPTVPALAGGAIGAVSGLLAAPFAAASRLMSGTPKHDSSSTDLQTHESCRKGLSGYDLFKLRIPGNFN
jgi:hypothetical protein